jgi:hypothetical protein
LSSPRAIKTISFGFGKDSGKIAETWWKDSGNMVERWWRDSGSIVETWRELGGKLFHPPSIVLLLSLGLSPPAFSPSRSGCLFFNLLTYFPNYVKI